MKGKIFSPDEANRMLPLVSRITDDIVVTYQDVHQALQAYEAAKTAAVEAPEGAPDRVSVLDAEVARHLDRFQGLIEEIEALGGTVKDYEHGCVDFYGEVDGEIVYLCWRRGEPSVGHWHRLDEGFGKRQALAVPSAA